MTIHSALSVIGAITILVVPLTNPSRYLRARRARLGTRWFLSPTATDSESVITRGPSRVGGYVAAGGQP